MNDQPTSTTPAGAEPMPDTGAATPYSLITIAEAAQRGLTLDGRRQELRNGHVYDFDTQTYWPTAPTAKLEEDAAAIEQGAVIDTGTEPERDDDPLERDKWQDRHGNPINLLASEGELLEYFRLPAWDTEDERTMWRREGVVASIERLGRARYSSVGEIVRRAGVPLGGMRVRAVDGETVDVTTRTLAEMRDDAHTELDASLQASQPEAARDFAEVLERLHRLQPPPVEAAPEPELTEVWRAVDQAFREAGGPASPTGIADATVEILRAARADQ